jgi:hypothetical protein
MLRQRISAKRLGLTVGACWAGSETDIAAPKTDSRRTPVEKR